MKESIIERIRETNPGETICLGHEECGELLKLIEEQEEQIAIMTERPVAHWVDNNGNYIPLDYEGFSTGKAYCSNCGDWLTASDEYPCRGLFCPNCGADMRGEQE